MRPSKTGIDTTMLVALLRRIGTPVTLHYAEVANLDPRTEIRFIQEPRDMGVTFDIVEPMDARGYIDGEFTVLA